MVGFGVGFFVAAGATLAVDSSGTISKVMVPAGQTGTGTYLVTWNGHGDALALYRIESSGSLTLANSYTYATWGKPTTATHNGIADVGFRFLYVGAWDVQWDSAYGLDLLYMHVRYYSPTLGRFLQPDPSRLDAKLFAYARNGPVTRVDPLGMDTHEVGAKLAIRDCNYVFCANVELNGLRIWVRWTTKRPCIPCNMVIDQATPWTVANAYRYLWNSGQWRMDPSRSYVRLVSGGKGKTYTTFKAVQGFTYWGLFSGWWILESLYYNQLTIWVTVRGNGGAGCAFDRYIKFDPPWPLTFVKPEPICRRFY